MNKMTVNPLTGKFDLTDENGTTIDLATAPQGTEYTFLCVFPTNGAFNQQYSFDDIPLPFERRLIPRHVSTHTIGGDYGVNNHQFQIILKGEVLLHVSSVNTGQYSVENFDRAQMYQGNINYSYLIDGPSDMYVKIIQSSSQPAIKELYLTAIII